MPCVHSQSFQPLVSMTRPSSSCSRNSPEVSLISTRLRISSWMVRSISAGVDTVKRWGHEDLLASVEVEQGHERPLDGPSVRMRLHEVVHVVPPAAHQRVLRQAARACCHRAASAPRRGAASPRPERSSSRGSRTRAAVARARARSRRDACWYSATLPGLSFMRNAWFMGLPPVSIRARGAPVGGSGPETNCALPGSPQAASAGRQPRSSLIAFYRN